MLIFGFSFLSSLIVLYTSSIFFNERLGKFFLILRISLMLEKNVCAYICSFWFLLFLMTFLPFFWKNFNFLKTSLLSLGGIGEGILEISALFPDFLDSFFFSGLLCEFLCVNLAKIYWWNDLLLWLVFKISYPTSDEWDKNSSHLAKTCDNRNFLFGFSLKGSVLNIVSYLEKICRDILHININKLISSKKRSRKSSPSHNLSSVG